VRVLKSLEYDPVARKAVILDHGSEKYVGRPSMDIEAAWTDLLRGKKRLYSFAEPRVA
jgi:hypothetical protein